MQTAPAEAAVNTNLWVNNYTACDNTVGRGMLTQDGSKARPLPHHPTTQRLAGPRPPRPNHGSTSVQIPGHAVISITAIDLLPFPGLQGKGQT